MKACSVKKLILFFLLWPMLAPSVHAEQRLRMATTTSTDNSGLLAVLNPVFEEQNKVKIDVIAVGTGKALRLGRNGDVDLILVHAPAAEETFVAEGYGVDRHPVMHNDFVLIGPADDPAGVKGTGGLSDVMRKIAQKNAVFISRGDDSGTHKKEKVLWKYAGVEPEGNWYLSVGQGMGAVLKIANDKQAYTLTDRGTWLAYRDTLDLVIVYEGDPVLFNPYHVIAINPERHPHVNHVLAKKYIDFITGVKGQAIIRDFTIKGERLFQPDAISDITHRYRGSGSPEASR